MQNVTPTHSILIMPADGFKVVAQSDGAPFAILADEKRRFYGMQFHPEVVHTVQAAQKGRLTAPRRANQRGHVLLEQVDIQPFQRLALAVPQVEVANTNTKVVARLLVTCIRLTNVWCMLLIHNGCLAIHKVSSWAPAYQRRSNFLRSTTAKALSEISTDSSTRMPPAVFSTKACSGSPDQVKI